MNLSLKTMVLAAWLALLSGQNIAQADKVYKILPLGDSITQAEINRASYRYFLWKKLIDAGIQFDFVGSMNTQLDTYSKGTPPQPDYKGHSFDPDHEGHFAWEVNHVLAGRYPHNKTGSGSIEQWLQNYDFDIALMHLGTNDAFQNREIAKTLMRLQAIVDKLRADNPNAVILLARIIPTTKGKREQTHVETLADLLPEVAQQLNTPESPVRLVDMFSEFDPEELTYDGIHPNEKGEQWMAQRWFEAIETALPLVKQ